jgi:serine/threonine-protein kinase HipA
MSRILTYLEIEGCTRVVGQAYFNFRRGRLTATFSYDRDYLGLRGAYAIDPVLRLTAGPWPLPQGLPGAFNDAATDRWGRNLIAKRLRAQASVEGRPTPNLDDRDYLLGVSDETRQGALRFKTDVDGEFQHPTPDVPKLIALPTLMHAADAVSRDEPDNMEAIKTLLDAGTGSLGGARPKASVRDGDRLLRRLSTSPRPQGSQCQTGGWSASKETPCSCSTGSTGRARAAWVTSAR